MKTFFHSTLHTPHYVTESALIFSSGSPVKKQQGRYRAPAGFRYVSNFPHAFSTENLIIPEHNGFEIGKLQDEKYHQKSIIWQENSTINAMR